MGSPNCSDARFPHAPRPVPERLPAHEPSASCLLLPPMRTLELLLPLGAIASAITLAPAQSQVQLPATANVADGNYESPSLFWGSFGSNRSHTQMLYPTADVGTGTATITALAFRRSSNSPYPNAATTVQLTIEMSVSTTPADAPSQNFAQNHGANRAVVFQGPVTLPASPAMAWPGSLLSDITLQNPFAYDGSAGASLVVDVTCSASTSHQIWRAAVQTVGYGTLIPEYIQSSCLTSEGDPSGGYGYNQFEPYPGGQFSLSLLGYARKASFQFSWLMIGFQGIGSGTGLPIPLTSLGLPANPNCQLAVSPDIVVAMNYIPGSQGNPGAIAYGPVPLANNPGLTGLVFHTQALSVDYDNTMPAPLFFPSMAHRWTFGTGSRPTCGTVTRLDDGVPANATGAVDTHAAPVLTLTLQ